MKHARTTFFAVAAAVFTPICAQAAATELIALAGSNASVELPAGWSVVPATGDRPFVMLNLCDPKMTDGCLVRAELRIEQLAAEQAPPSLEAGLEQWRRGGTQDVVVAPSRLKIGERDSIESVTRGAHSDHVSKQVFFDTILLQEGVHYYACSMTMDPQDYIALKSVLHDFCASLRFATATSG